MWGGCKQVSRRLDFANAFKFAPSPSSRYEYSTTENKSSNWFRCYGLEVSFLLVWLSCAACADFNSFCSTGSSTPRGGWRVARFVPPPSFSIKEVTSLSSNFSLNPRCQATTSPSRRKSDGSKTESTQRCDLPLPLPPLRRS